MSYPGSRFGIRPPTAAPGPGGEPRNRLHLPARVCPAHNRSRPIPSPDNNLRRSSGQEAALSQVPSVSSGSSRSSWQQQAAPAEQAAIQRMLAQGRCKHQVKHLSNTYGSKTLSCLATLEVSNHRRADHAACSNETACVAYNTKPGTYAVRHVHPDCNCQTVATPYEHLIQVIRKGGIPLISIGSDVDHGITPQLRVHSRSRRSKYIAISHVWFDGFGNPNENALPTCQLQALKGRLAALREVLNITNGDDRILFWMDTLCIPVAEEDLSLKHDQIDKMASIYRGAVTALVLDAELMNTPVEFVPIPPADRASNRGNAEDLIRLSTLSHAQIACSIWMSRSWTLQEGQLPSTIAIQFSNDVVVLGRTEDNETYRERSGKEHTRTRSCVNTMISRPIVPAASGRDNAMGALSLACECPGIALQENFFLTFFDDYYSFVNVWNELTGRSTTEPKDVPMIITNMMGFNNQNLLTYRDSAEMYLAILLSLPTMPLSIFFNIGARQDPLGNHQNRWVPRKVGDVQLEEYNLLSIRPSHLEYRWQPTDFHERIHVYMVDKAFRIELTVYLPTRSSEYYSLEPANTDPDQLDITRFDSTWIFVEKPMSYESSNVARGACFFGRARPAARDGWPEIDLTFDRPIRVRLLADAEFEDSDVEDAFGSSMRSVEDLYLFRSAETKYIFRINYDPPSKFRRLTTRDDLLMKKPLVINAITVWISAVVVLAITFLLFGLIIAYVPAPASIGVAILALIGIPAIFAIIFVSRYTRLMDKVQAWAYIRSLETVIRNRPSQGSV